MRFFVPLLASFSVCAAATTPICPDGGATEPTKAPAVEPTCPPPGFTSKLNLNPAVYFDGMGYTLKMVTVGSTAPVYCDYGVLSHTVNATDNTVVPRVVIGSNNGSVTGAHIGLALNGKIPDLTKPGQTVLSLGPANIPYWVIEAGSFDELLAGKTEFKSESYDWVITATGGPPTTKTAGGCLPPAGMALRVVSKVAKVSKEVEDKLIALTKSKGYDVSALAPVAHEGCTYV